MSVSQKRHLCISSPTSTRAWINLSFRNISCGITYLQHFPFDLDLGTDYPKHTVECCRRAITIMAGAQYGDTSGILFYSSQRYMPRDIHARFNRAGRIAHFLSRSAADSYSGY